MSVKDVTLEEALEVSATQQFAVIDFYGVSCGPCKALAPVLDAVAGEFETVSIVKVDTDQEGVGTHLQTLGVRAVPTLIFYKDNVEVKRISGYQPLSKLREVVQDFIA
jgi:thioredoxin 1